MFMRIRSLLVAAGLAAGVALSASPGRAESSVINVHVNPTLVLPQVGGGVTAGADWQFRRGFALDAVVGGFGASDGAVSATAIAVFNVAAGVRFRFFDSHRGYATEPGGDLPGNLFVVPRLGALLPTQGSPALAIDVEAGYELSIARPFQLGVFVRPGVAIGANVGPYVLTGLTLSFGVGPEIVKDTDHDGVEDELDACPGTPIGARVDPRGCVREIGDSDHDGVRDDRDECPGTRRGAKVDARGCTIVPKQIVLRGIRFGFDSADIDPESTSSLEEVAAGLRDNPKVRVEIGGHSDDQGDAGYNLRLSQRRAEAVADWLAKHGVERGRMVTRGFGKSKPVAPNDTDENRALNRRIEFLRLD
jgi:outer membrane protein OmpA-like peptidoglycan-associated protein